MSSQAHSSVGAALGLLAMDPLVVPVDDGDRLTGAALEAAIAADPDPDSLCAVVATAGTTNAGIVDDLAGVADVAAARGLWLHVDGAYGAAAVLAPSVRARFDGIGRADSVILDPHKWLFGPLDCCALLYRDPSLALAVHRQSAAYLEPLHQAEAWNPSDYAFHLTRRARGLPLWFGLAVHGSDAYAAAIESTLALTREVAELVRAGPGLDLIAEPELSVLVVRRRGWAAEDYFGWSRRLLEDQTAFVVPTRWREEVVARLVFLHPRTTIEDARAVLATLA